MVSGAVLGTQKKMQHTWTCCLAFILLLLISLTVVVLSYQTFKSCPGVNVDTTTEFVRKMEAEKPRIISRSSWNAELPTGKLDNNPLPIRRVIVCYTSTQGCDTEDYCSLLVRSFQRYHVENRKWFDIGYNFLVGGDNNVYEGRGWDFAGAHTRRYNSGSVGIAFIGNFKDHLPSKGQLAAFHQLVELGVQMGKIAPDYSLVAQCQLTPTEAPGRALAMNMTTWPHFDSSLPFQCSGLINLKLGGQVEPA